MSDVVSTEEPETSALEPAAVAGWPAVAIATVPIAAPVTTAAPVVPTVPAAAPVNPLLEAALKYAKMGWPVLPLHHPVFVPGRPVACSCPKREKCTSIGKEPRTQHGLKDASTDEAKIRRWWEIFPDANIGIVTGNGIGVIDVDLKHNGLENWAALVEAHGGIPDTVEAITGSGGRHLFFRVDGPVKNSTSELAPGVDVRGDGGYVVVALSRHSTGNYYTWELSSDPLNGAVMAKMPDWLFALCAKNAARAFTPNTVGGPVSEESRVQEGSRNESLFKLGRSMRSKGAETPAILAALLKMNETQCVPPLDPKEVETIATSAAKVPAGLSEEAKAQIKQNADGRKAEQEAKAQAKALEAQAKALQKKIDEEKKAQAAAKEKIRLEMLKKGSDKAKSTLRSVMNNVSPSKTSALDSDDDDSGNSSSGNSGSDSGGSNDSGAGGPGNGNGGDDGGREGFTIYRGDATELASLLLRQLREKSSKPVVYDRSEFWRYEDAGSSEGLWKIIDRSLARNEASFFAGEMIDKKPLKLSAGEIKGIVDVASDYALRRDFFNDAPSGILFRNGFVTVRDGVIELQPHSPHHRASIRMEFDFDPEFVPERWNRFLEEVFTFPFEGDMPDETRELLAVDRADRIAFLQEHAGASLLGEATKYQTCALLVGELASNGKSTYLDVIKALFPRGSVASSSPQDWIKRCYLAELAGVRLNAVAELPDREIIESGSFKSVVTGDSMMVDAKYGKPFNLVPVAGQLFACNGLPATRDQTDGFFRRFMVVPFDRKFEKHEVEIDLAKRLISTELPGIAVWAIEGLSRLQLAKRYTTPTSSSHLKDQWQLDSDQVRQWLTECTEEGGQTTPSKAYESYVIWSRRTGHHNLSMQKFSKRLAKLIDQKHSGQERYYPRSIKPEWLPRYT